MNTNTEKSQMLNQNKAKEKPKLTLRLKADNKTKTYFAVI